jgi:hypothetical protein
VPPPQEASAKAHANATQERRVRIFMYFSKNDGVRPVRRGGTGRGPG